MLTHALEYTVVSAFYSEKYILAFAFSKRFHHLPGDRIYAQLYRPNNGIVFRPSAELKHSIDIAGEEFFPQCYVVDVIMFYQIINFVED